ncbi:unnamed protein product [Euphydryas editha]|uniref:Chorein N-terminal domain-containing protein n=1 Tax=Euphydryas editha TaxID=104508 RepID=A0AAU9V055_EUPED|nr:unnamed protein product [Euphydryas editha]
MFKIESYITPILLSYVDKYVRDFKPADAQVSLWGGGVTLHNLVLKADVLQQEVSLPFTLVSGRIHELLIQVPWTKIMSEPIIVTINTIECVLSLNPPPEEIPPQETQSGRSQVVEAPPGYMQALVRRIVSNIAVRVNSLIVKYVQDDIVLSLNVKKFAVDSVGVNWEPTFADIDQSQPAIRRLVRLDDLTLCLDKTDSDGKIRFYHEPLLYRCQLDLRVLTRLVSVNTRRARSLSVQLLSSRLAWGVNSEQLVLLLRLLRERTPVETKSPPPAPKQMNVQAAPLHVTASTSAEPARSESWSEWAWSWLPAWDRDGVDESPAPATPIPIAFTAHFNLVSLVFKILETEGTTRKRARSILELTAADAVVKSFICFPTLLRVNFGARGVTLASHGRCVCGHLDTNSIQDEPTIHLNKIETDNEEPWSWVEQELTEQSVEQAIAVNEDEQFEELNDEPHEFPERIVGTNRQGAQAQAEVDEFWLKMAPVIYFEYSHERTPASDFINPYDNPPRDFEYSDWVEDCSLKITIRPILISVSTGLLHRIAVVRKAFEEVPAVEEMELPMRVLTVEECDALSENLPVRRTSIDVNGLRVRFIPSAHSITERSARAPLVLDVQLPTASLIISAPLYPHRVCSAACQILEESAPLFQGARLHTTFKSTIQVGVSAPDEDAPRPCARTDIHFVTHSLLNRTYFKKPETVLFGYTAETREANICGSSARLQAAYYVAQSLINEKLADPLRNSTLAKDALNDEEYVAVDVTLEELSMRRFTTRNVNTLFIMINSIKATAFHSPEGGDLKQAWIFSGPDVPTVIPYFEGGFQWCNEPNAQDSLEFIHLCIKPTALSVDPLLVAWLSYRYKLTPVVESTPQIPSVKTLSSSQYLSRRRVTPPSSSGRGASRSGSGAELVHMRPRSLESSSERSEKKEPKHPPQKKPGTQTWSSDNLLQLYERLNRLLIIAEVGLVQLYVASTTVSALDCATIRDAMERHATTANNVLVVSLGRILMESNVQIQYLWAAVKFDRPSHRTRKRDPNVNEESFPWKIDVLDMSCYTLEVRAGSERSGRERSASGLRSQLKASRVVVPRQVLELVTTTIMVSVVTKSLKIKSSKKSEEKVKREHARDHAEDKTKYFTTGTDFKPSSLKEFIRGPARRKKTSPEPEKSEPAPEPAPTKTKIKIGPVISLGVNLYADTPPIIFKLDQDQVQTVALAMHCFAHVMTLLRRPPATPKQGSTSLGGSQKSIIRSVSELDARQSISEETASENRSEPLISIYEPHKIPESDTEMKTFFWFQWVVSRATLVVATPHLKLAFEVDDIITTVDFQNHYNQLKVKVASASVRYYKCTDNDEWTPGVLGGRILEVREPTNAEEDHFLTITVTQAQISNLPVSWKEELHPKLLEHNANADSMWEVYATLAPLEAVLRPDILENLMTWLHEMTPQSLCPLKAQETKPGEWQWPSCYVTAGGLRLLMTTGENVENTCDDTLMLVIGKVTVSPHPENPICRQSVNQGTDTTWTPLSPGLDGRQYEVLIRHLAIRSAQFSQLVNQEAMESETLKGTGSENPALKWSQPVVSPVITPLLHSVDVGCIVAPAMYSGGAMISGPAIELNLLSDCSVELGVERIELLQTLIQKVLHVFRHRSKSSFLLEEENTCPYATHIGNQETTEAVSNESEPTLTETEETPKSSVEPNRSYIFDSGVETTTSQSTYKKRRDSVPIKKSVSIVCADHTAIPSDYLEVYVTMGVIDLSLYVKDDDSREVRVLRPPPGQYNTHSEPRIKVVIDESKDIKTEDGKDSMAASRSLTETIRNVDIGKTKLELMHILPLARKAEGNIPLLHATLHQPNLYYWNRKKQKTIQISLFNAWIGLGEGPGEDHWNAPLLTTTRGSPDPVTDIPPALATLRVDLSPGGFPSFTSSSGRGNVQLDVERPVMLEVSMDRLQRLKGIIALVDKNVKITKVTAEQRLQRPVPLLYKIRQNMVRYEIESVIVQTGQIGVRGSEGAVGCDGVRLQLATGERPQRLTCRALLTAAVLTSGPHSDRRHVVLQPLMAGAVIDATWEAWKRAEGGSSACEPTLRVGIDLDRIILDLRPLDLATVARIHNNAKEIFDFTESPTLSESTDSQVSLKSQSSGSTYANQQSASETDPTNHFYKDDLRSGAFKIVVGCQLPMAYQVTLHGSTVSWRYPHPRAITRLIAYPMPNLEDEQVECVLELYCSMLARWEPHTYFKLPVTEPREMVLSSSPTGMKNIHYIIYTIDIDYSTRLCVWLYIDASQ